jgi:hypothetical protein
MRSGVVAVLFRRLAILRHRFWSVVAGADIPLNCQIGGRVCSFRIPMESLFIPTPRLALISGAEMHTAFPKSAAMSTLAKA